MPKPLPKQNNFQPSTKTSIPNRPSKDNPNKSKNINSSTKKRFS